MSEGIKFDFTLGACTMLCNLRTLPILGIHQNLQISARSHLNGKSLWRPNQFMRLLGQRLRDIWSMRDGVVEEYLHPTLTWDTTNTDKRMRFDLWVPKLSLSFEYQGPLLLIVTHPSRSTTLSRPGDHFWHSRPPH